VSASISGDDISASTCLSLSENVTLQALGEAEGGVLLKLDTGEMYTVNDTTLAFLQQLGGDRTIAEIASRLVEVFDTDETTLLADLVEIGRDLAGEALVVAHP
jgi:hypothetical protein